jgi:hypothetical protein
MQASVESSTIFKSVTLKITLESQKEVDMFNNIFDCYQILEATDRCINGTKIRDSLDDYTSKGTKRHDLWLRFFRKLKESFRQGDI